MEPISKINKLFRKNIFLRSIFRLYQFIFIIPFFGFWTFLLFITIFIPLMIFGNPIARFGGMIWAKITTYITFVRLKLSGTCNIKQNQSYVIVANHQSNYDIFAFYGWLPIDFRWVMKKEMRKAPIIGLFCEKAGHILIDRRNTDAAVKSLNEAANKICNGTSILFFPEGTRNDGECLLPFKKGAFKMALDLNLPILPITIRGSNNIMHPNKIQVYPGKIEIIIHEPIDISKHNIDSLINASRAAIQSAL